MTDYKELLEELRDKACNSEGYDRELSNRSADAIEQLIIDSEDYKEILFSCQEELKQAQAKCEEMEATLDTEIEYGNELKRKINSLKHDGYYTGTYIKALMEHEMNEKTEENHDLLKELIFDNSNEGDIIFDPCMGSGSHGLVAVQNRRNFIGIELDEGYFKIAEERINNARLNQQTGGD